MSSFSKIAQEEKPRTSGKDQNQSVLLTAAKMFT